MIWECVCGKKYDVDENIGGAFACTACGRKIDPCAEDCDLQIFEPPYIQTPMRPTNTDSTGLIVICGLLAVVTVAGAFWGIHHHNKLREQGEAYVCDQIVHANQQAQQKMLLYDFNGAMTELTSAQAQLQRSKYFYSDQKEYLELAIDDCQQQKNEFDQKIASGNYTVFEGKLISVAEKEHILSERLQLQRAEEQKRIEAAKLQQQKQLAEASQSKSYVQTPEKPWHSDGDIDLDKHHSVWDVICLIINIIVFFATIIVTLSTSGSLILGIGVGVFNVFVSCIVLTLIECDPIVCLEILGGAIVYVVIRVAIASWLGDL
jgi:hypothetical protein